MHANGQEDVEEKLCELLLLLLLLFIQLKPFQWS